MQAKQALEKMAESDTDFDCKFFAQKTLREAPIFMAQ